MPRIKSFHKATAVRSGKGYKTVVTKHKGNISMKELRRLRGK